MTGSDWVVLAILLACTLWGGRLFKRVLTALAGFLLGCLLLCLLSLALQQAWCPPMLSSWFEQGTVFRLIGDLSPRWLGGGEPPGMTSSASIEGGVDHRSNADPARARGWDRPPTSSCAYSP